MVRPALPDPLALAGVGLLLVSSLVVKKKRKLLGWSVLALAVLLAATATVFNLTGLSTGETTAEWHVLGSDGDHP